MKLMPLLAGILIIAGVSLCSGQDPNSTIENTQMPRSPIGFVKGFSWGTFGRNGEYSSPQAEESIKLLAETNANYVSIVFAIMMRTKNSPEIFWGRMNPYMASDEDIRYAIRLAQKNNLNVILKPVVNCADGQWRGYINFKTVLGKPDYPSWELWWKNYSAAMVHYAKLAQDTNCRLFCIGCEMNETETFESDWRKLVAEIRKNYRGPLTYNANHGRETNLAWWDAVDMIGISAYYPVGTSNTQAALAEDMNNLDKNSSLEEMNRNWAPICRRLRQLALKWNRPVLFMEIGVRSAKGSSAVPWEWYNDWPYDAQEQARYYQAALENFWNEPWFAGYAWWAWHSYLYPKEEAASDRSFCPYGKPAEDIVKSWYGKKR
ncbi:MAG: glycosyl hydrolase family 53 [Sedimentisphaerales bacterium]